MINGVSSGNVYLVDREGYLSEERRDFFLYYQKVFFTKKQGNQALFSSQDFLSFYLRLPRSNAQLFMNKYFGYFYPDEQKAIFQMLFPKPMNAVYQQMVKHDVPTVEILMKRKFAFCYLLGERFEPSIFQLWQETVCAEDKYRWIPLLPPSDQVLLMTKMPFDTILDCLSNLPKVETARILYQLFEGTFLTKRVFYAHFYALWRETQSKIFANPLEAPAYRLIPFFPTHIQAYMCWASVDCNYAYNLSGIISHLSTLSENDANYFAERLLSPPAEDVNEKAARYFDTDFVIRLQKLTKSGQFNQLLSYLSTANLLAILKKQNMPVVLPVLSKRVKHLPEPNKLKFLREELLDFCYIRGQFDMNRFYPWYEQLPQSSQIAVFDMLPIQFQVAVFHVDRKTCIEPLHQQVCQQVGTEQQNMLFQEIFSFCFNQGFFNLSVFRDWQRHAHPVEKHRWDDFAYRFAPSASPSRLSFQSGAVATTVYGSDLHGEDSHGPLLQHGLHFAYDPQFNGSVNALITDVEQLDINQLSQSPIHPKGSRFTKGNGW